MVFNAYGKKKEYNCSTKPLVLTFSIFAVIFIMTGEIL